MGPLKDAKVITWTYYISVSVVLVTGNLLHQLLVARVVRDKLIAVRIAQLSLRTKSLRPELHYCQHFKQSLPPDLRKWSITQLWLADENIGIWDYLFKSGRQPTITGWQGIWGGNLIWLICDSKYQPFCFTAGSIIIFFFLFFEWFGKWISPTANIVAKFQTIVKLVDGGQYKFIIFSQQNFPSLSIFSRWSGKHKPFLENWSIKWRIAWKLYSRYSRSIKVCSMNGVCRTT